MQLRKPKQKENQRNFFFKEDRGKIQLNSKRAKIEITFWKRRIFSSESMQARIGVMNYLKCQKKKVHQPRLLHAEKLPFKVEAEIKTS